MNDQPNPARPSGGPYVPTWQKVARVILFACLALPVLALLGLVGWSYIDDYRGSRELAAALEVARKTGFPIDYRDRIYLAWDVEPIDIDSAAFFYVQAFPQVGAVAMHNAGTRLPLIGRRPPLLPIPPTPADPLSPELLDELRPYVANNSDVFDLLRRASSAGSPGKFPIRWDGVNTLLPHLTYARSAARMAALKTWLDAEEDRPSEAVLDVLDGLAIARPLLEEPLMISHVVAAAIHSIAIGQGLGRVLARTDPSDADLATLQRALSDAASSLNVEIALKGGVPMLGDEFERWAAGRDLFESWGFSGGGPNLSSGTSFSGQQRVSRWLRRGAVKRQRARLVALLVRLGDDARNPRPESLSAEGVGASGDAIAASMPWSAALNKDFSDSFHNYAKLIQIAEVDRMRLRSAAASVAALRFRCAAGAWPESLAALVPAYLDSVPLDSFTGRPLVYNKTGEGIKVYSVGPDGVDDDGKPTLETRPPDVDEKSWEKYDDVGFRIWRREPSAAPTAGEPEKES